MVVMHQRYSSTDWAYLLLFCCYWNHSFTATLILYSTYYMIMNVPLMPKYCFLFVATEIVHQQCLSTSFANFPQWNKLTRRKKHIFAIFWSTDSEWFNGFWLFRVVCVYTGKVKRWFLIHGKRSIWTENFGASKTNTHTHTNTSRKHPHCVFSNTNFTKTAFLNSNENLINLMQLIIIIDHYYF